MSELKNKINGILSQRNQVIDKLVAEDNFVNDMEQHLRKIQQKVVELALPSSTEQSSKIEKFISDLGDAKKKVSLLRKRYQKDTINIGVSGFTHAGKSTLLQALSGLTDDEIPKANENSDNSLHATTAICSQIYNSPDKYAEVTYKSSNEFVDFVNAHLQEAGIATRISSVHEMASLVIPDNLDCQVDSNTLKERLRMLQESFPYYRNKIDNGKEKISGDRLNQLDSYVSYSKDDKTTRFFPAVKEVKIYCPFPALGDPDIKLCLVDLPGFGEFGAVDEIQIKGLKEIVDHIVFIYKVNTDEAISNKKYRDCYREISHIHEDQQNNTEFLLNFLSFLINEDRRISTWENLRNQTIGNDGIKKHYGNYDYYSFPATDNVEATENFNRILTRLADTLPKMDEILTSSLGKSLNVSEISLLLKDLSKYVQQYSYSNDDPYKFHDNGVRFREDFSKALELLLEQYRNNSEEIDNNFCQKVNDIAAQTEKDITDNLLYIPREGRQTWDNFIYYTNHGDNATTFASELRRVWVETLKRYINLDEDYSEHVRILKQEILSKFDELGHIVPKDSNGEYDLSALLEKLQCLDADNEITFAFASLQSLTQNFRQNLYPYIFKEGLEKGMLTTANGGIRELDTTQDLRVIANYKSQLIPMCKNNNYEISKSIKNNFVLSHFLIGALHTFIESLTFTKTDFDADFVKFCSIFRKDIYPAEYGNAADSVKMEELNALVEKTKELISNIQ